MIMTKLPKHPKYHIDKHACGISALAKCQRYQAKSQTRGWDLKKKKLLVDNNAGVSFLSLCRCSLSWVTSNWKQFSQAIPASSTLWPSRWPSQLIINIYPGTQPPKGWGEKRKRPGCSGCLCRWRRRREGAGPPGGEAEEGEQGWSGTQTTLLDRFFVLL